MRMPVSLPRTLRHREGRLFDAFHVLCALAAALIPLAVFVVVSYHEALNSAEAKLSDIVKVARAWKRSFIRPIANWPDSSR